jgi:hypothetical protein
MVLTPEAIPQTLEWGMITAQVLNKFVHVFGTTSDGSRLAKTRLGSRSSLRSNTLAKEEGNPPVDSEASVAKM